MTEPYFRIKKPIDLRLTDLSKDFRIQAETHLAAMLEELSAYNLGPEHVVLEAGPYEISPEIDLNGTVWDVKATSIRVTQTFRLRLKTDAEIDADLAAKEAKADEDEVYEPRYARGNAGEGNTWA